MEALRATKVSMAEVLRMEDMDTRKSFLPQTKVVALAVLMEMVVLVITVPLVERGFREMVLVMPKAF